jgi:hypothetical protein
METLGYYWSPMGKIDFITFPTPTNSNECFEVPACQKYSKELDKK